MQNKPLTRQFPAQCGEVNVQPVSTVTVGYLGPPAFISASQAQHEASFAVLLGIVLHSPNQLAAVSPRCVLVLPTNSQDPSKLPFARPELARGDARAGLRLSDNGARARTLRRECGRGCP